MKKIAFVLSILILSAVACKSKQASQQNNLGITQTSSIKGKTLGNVSHQYASSGCHTVIVIINEDTSNNITIIPKDALPTNFDQDGLQIYFDFHPLKMPQPEGCFHGFPAEITNISIKE